VSALAIKAVTTAEPKPTSEAMIAASIILCSWRLSA
jgi:hypothetical protein